LLLSSASLNFANALEFDFYPAWWRTSEGFVALSALFATGGYAAAFAGFRHPTSRRRRLRLAASFFAASGAAGLVDHLIRSVKYLEHPVDGTFTGAEIVGATASLAFLVAGVIAAVAFRSAMDSPRRDLVLGWAVLGLVAYFGLNFVSLLLYAIGYSHLHAPDGIVDGLGVQAAGAAIGAGGAMAAAIAFLRRGPEEEGRLAGRDRLLAEGATIVGLGYLASAIGALVYAGSISDFETDSKQTAANWLSGVNYVGLMCAAICAGVAFRASRRALEQRDGSDPATLADPG
jgi:hypothetical protein